MSIFHRIPTVHIDNLVPPLPHLTLTVHTECMYNMYVRLEAPRIAVQTLHCYSELCKQLLAYIPSRMPPTNAARSDYADLNVNKLA